MRIEGDQLALERGKACRIKHASAEVADFAIARVVATVIGGSNDVFTHRPYLIARHPQQHLGLRQPLCDIAMVAMPRDTPITVGGASTEGA